MCLEPLKDKTAIEVAKAFEKIIFRVGMPKAVVCDNGQEFIAQVFQAICDCLHIKKAHTSPHHPESNGACESSQKEINKHLRLALQVYNRDWAEAVHLMEYVHNSTPLSGIAFCPFYLMYHRWPTQWQDLPLLKQNAPSKRRAEYDEYVEYITARLTEARTIMLNTQLRDKESRLIKSDAKRRDLRFEVGDEVLVWRPAAASTAMDKTSAKLLWAAVGPMRVLKYNGRNTYTVEHLSTKKRYRVNVRDMFPYCNKKSTGTVAQDEEKTEESSPPVAIKPTCLPLPNILDVNLCAEGQWVCIPRERRWFLAKIISYDEGSDEVKAHYYCTHLKNGRQQLKPSWYHPGSKKEILGTKGPKGYLAYTEVLERKLLYPQVVQVVTKCTKKRQITHEVSVKTAKDLQQYAEGPAVDIEEVRVVRRLDQKRYPQPFMVKSTAQEVRSRKQNLGCRAIKVAQGILSAGHPITGNLDVTPPAAPTRSSPPRLNRRGLGHDQSPTGVGDLIPRDLEQSMVQIQSAGALRQVRRRSQGTGGMRTRSGPRKRKPPGKVCDHVPCQRPAQDALPAFHDPIGIEGPRDNVPDLWLCAPCAEDTAAHLGPNTRSHRLPGEPHAVWYQETCDACGEEDPPVDLKDLPPRTPRRRRKRSESPEHSPEYVSARKNQTTPGSNYLTTPRPIRGSPRRQTCILKGCTLMVEEGSCSKTSKPKLACTKAHYLRHIKRRSRTRKQKDIDHKVWNETNPLR
jgi:hypothetical protein